eukprot:6257443-Lingulodinium_polyedra.AAC.1
MCSTPLSPTVTRRARGARASGVAGAAGCEVAPLGTATLVDLGPERRAQLPGVPPVRVRVPGREWGVWR